MALSCITIASDLYAGGSGLNTVVVVNQTSSNSCELGNYFCERRGVPPQNMLRINWSGTNTSWTSDDFQTNLVTPLLAMLAGRALTNQVDYVVLSMDIPFQTSLGTNLNGTTSALFYGLKIGGGLDPGVTNSYAASEASFRQATPASAPGYSFLATMITDDSLAQAEQLVDQGVAGDGSLPSAPVVLAKSSDPARNIRYPYFDNAIFNVDILGVSSILRSNTDSLWGQSAFLGYETGLAQFSLAPETFVPGAIGDSLTSFGGVIFGPNTQTNLLAFIDAGAAGSYGTVAEPGTDTQKFPNPQVYFYQARGFSLAESYYQSISAPYLGLMVAEPLAAPFARAGFGQWAAGVSNSVLSGASELSVQFWAFDANHPLQQIDLFVDGTYFSTLTNVAPCPGNLLTATLNGYPVTYTIATNDTPGTIAAALAALINTPTVANATLVTASVYGDRVELHCVATNPLAVPYYVADPNSASATGSTYTVAYLTDSYPPLMIPGCVDKSGVFHMQMGIPTALDYTILASTDLVNWVPIFTNTVAGLVGFEDVNATNYTERFYRLVGPVPGQLPMLSAPGIASGGGFQAHLASQPGQPCAILASTNLVNWVPVFTNQAGGAVEFLDSAASNSGCRFYRAWVVPPTPPAFTVVNGASPVTLVRVSSAVQPYIVGVATNGGQWTALDTNFNVAGIQTATASATGGASTLSTFLAAGRSTFMASQAFGRLQYVVLTNPPPPAGAWLQFTITKTNGQSVVVAVTNVAGTASSADLTGQLCSLINTNPALQTSDGIVAEDFAVNPSGTITFNLRAQSPGYQGAAVLVTPKRSGVIILPSNASTLTQNLSDLQPRNHLYVTAGAVNLVPAFLLDTTTLSDGYHELTATAYEGSNLRTQTRAVAPVWVQNTSLSASLTLLDLPNPSPVQGTYHIQVAANTNTVSTITLFSTGGALAAATNQSTAIFEVDGTNLWAGLHPFYALVQTSDGLTYRTATQSVRLTNGP